MEATIITITKIGMISDTFIKSVYVCINHDDNPPQDRIAHFLEKCQGRQFMPGSVNIYCSHNRSHIEVILAFPTK